MSSKSPPLAAVGDIARGPEPPTQSRRLLDAREVAALLGCSWRTVLRLADAGRVPWGVKLGALRRWDLHEVQAFIAGGCRPPRRTTP